jgi:hypothetical protein
MAIAHASLQGDKASAKQDAKQLQNSKPTKQKQRQNKPKQN